MEIRGSNPLGGTIQRKPYWFEHIGDWEFRIVDGTPAVTEADESNRLPQVHLAYETGVGGFCQVGGYFTAAGIAFVEPQ